MSKQAYPICIVGGGLAGGLLAIYLAKLGFKVNVFERRPDLRKANISAGRSINLALSTRGIFALHEVGLDNELLKIAIPMRGRMIHSRSGEINFAAYGRDDSEYINSVSRGALNAALLDAAQKYPNVSLYFEERCIGIDVENGDVYFENQKNGGKNAVKSSTIFGCDGAFSEVRNQMLKTPRFDYTQSFLEHSYKELNLPPNETGEFRFEKNALHIWPRGGYMLIALPNTDGSYTCTLFLAHSGSEKSFEGLNTLEKVQAFFETEFSDITPHFSNLCETFFANPTGDLVTIKCFPWHVKDKVLLVGDAAHAIVPFYGQGMNCAFEDCTYLNTCIKKYGDDWERVFIEYESLRKINTDAIAELALDNFIEMRDSVANPKFLLKKELEHTLENTYPGKFISKYSMVTFHRIPYIEAMQKGRLQDKIITGVCEKVNSMKEVNVEEVYNSIQAVLT